MFKLSFVFVVRFYCSNEDVEYGFNFDLLRDETINVTTLTEATLSKQLFVSQRLSTLVKESIKRRAVSAYFEVFCEYFGTVTTRK